MVGRLVGRGQLLGKEIVGPVGDAIGPGLLGNLEQGVGDMHIHGRVS